MKKTFIFGIILASIGAILMGLGYTHNGNKNVTWQNGGFKLQDGRSVSKTFSDVDNIRLNSSDHVEVKSYNGSKVKVNYHKNDAVTYQARTNQLSISSSAHDAFSFGFVFSNFKSHNIVIYVPQTTTIDNFTANVDDGISITDMNFNQLNISSEETMTLSSVKVANSLKLNNEDDINLDHVTAPRLVSNTSDGDIDIRNSSFASGLSTISTSDSTTNIKDTKFEKVKISSSDGHIRLTNLDISQSLSGDTSDGDIDVTLKDRNDISIRTNVDDGSSRIFGKKTSHYDHGKRQVFYNFDSSDGNVIIH